jgi:hypothetical protein
LVTGLRDSAIVAGDERHQAQKTVKAPGAPVMDQHMPQLIQALEFIAGACGSKGWEAVGDGIGKNSGEMPQHDDPRLLDPRGVR